MYIKIRRIDNTNEELLLNVTKKTFIQEIKEILSKEWNCAISAQRLFYKGKQLSTEYRILDYDIQLNDVIQLDIKINRKNTNACLDLVNVDSNFYKEGDFVDVQCSTYGSWWEAVIVGIKKYENREITTSMSTEDIERTFMFFIRWDLPHVEKTVCAVNFDRIRPRTYSLLKFEDLNCGDRVLVNYNIEAPDMYGYWYEFNIKRLNPESELISGTIYLGPNNFPIPYVNIKYSQNVYRIENHILLSKRENFNALKDNLIFSKCSECNDDAEIICYLCGCFICGRKNNPEKIIMCDECDNGYHYSCLNPPLSAVPLETEWYCPECKNEDNIIKIGDKLRINKRKANRPSAKLDPEKVWGRGMACVGRTKECTIVPVNHYGPIPGIEVGTRWKFRIQVSEAGVHRPSVAGIHGRETDGAYSLVLAGGYEDDHDNGSEFFYTGSGGRDFSGNKKRSANQSFDQTLIRMNKALALNCYADFNEEIGAESSNWKQGKAVRVCRSSKFAKQSKFAPKDGIRYDGIYKVVKYYKEKGKSGFIVWKYLLRRDDPTPAPWEADGHEFEIIYPDGYLEAKKLKENLAHNQITSDKETEQEMKPKKSFTLDEEMQNLIKADKLNKKLWQECINKIQDGKYKFIIKIQESFTCICCQEIVFQPVTTKCKHNTCLVCLQRSFESEIYQCPYCRKELGKNYKMPVNETLSKILLLLLPGYEKHRL